MTAALDINSHTKLTINHAGQASIPVVTLKVKSIQFGSNELPRVHESYITGNFYNLYSGVPLKIGDFKSVVVRNTAVKLKLKKISYRNYQSIRELPEGVKEWIIDHRTGIELDKGKYSAEVISKEPANKPFKVDCELKIEAGNIADLREPFFINYNDLIEKISIFLTSNPIIPGASMECVSGEDKLTVIIQKITDLYSGNIHTEPGESIPITMMGPHIHIDFEPLSPIVSLGKNKIHNAETLIVQIVAIRCHDPLENQPNSQCFFIDDILTSLIKFSNGLVWKGKPWRINVQNRKGSMNTLEIEVLGGSSINGNLSDADPSTKLAKLWKINLSTKLNIHPHIDLSQIRIGNSSIPIPAARVYAEYEILSKPLTGVPIIVKEDLIEVIKRHSKTIMNGDRICYKSPSNCMIEITLENITTSSEQNALFPPLAVITNRTEFSLSPSDRIQSPLTERKNLLASPSFAKEFLLFSGIGGFDDHFTDYLDLLKAQLVLEKERYFALGQRPSKGMLLYGPKGSQKNKAVHKICQWLNVQHQNFYTLNSAEFTQTWKGQLESEFRARFEKAFEDYKMEGKKSPLHIIHIADIDTLAGTEIAEEGSSKTQLNKIFSGIAGEWPQLLIIATTTRIKAVNPDLLRPGNFEKQFQIGPPSYKGRTAVFSIYTKTLRQNGAMDENVSNERLADLTTTYTSAEIEYAVKCAFEIADKRYRSDRFKRLCVTFEDFESAIQTINKLKNEEQDKVGSYIS